MSESWSRWGYVKMQGDEPVMTSEGTHEVDIAD